MLRHEQRGNSIHFYGKTEQACRSEVMRFNERINPKGFCLEERGTYQNTKDGSWIGIAVLKRCI